jgi:hypothetical protein
MSTQSSLERLSARALLQALYPRLLAVFDRGDTPPPAGGRKAVRPPSRRPPRPRPHSAAVGVLPPLKVVATRGYTPLKSVRRNIVRSRTPAVRHTPTCWRLGIALRASGPGARHRVWRRVLVSRREPSGAWHRLWPFDRGWEGEFAIWDLQFGIRVGGRGDHPPEIGSSASAPGGVSSSRSSRKPGGRTTRCVPPRFPRRAYTASCG